MYIFKRRGQKYIKNTKNKLFLEIIKCTYFITIQFF